MAKFNSFKGRCLASVPGFERKSNWLRSDTVKFNSGALGAAAVTAGVALVGGLAATAVKSYIEDRSARRVLRDAMEAEGMSPAAAKEEVKKLKAPAAALAKIEDAVADAEADSLLARASRAKKLRAMAESLSEVAETTAEPARAKRTA